MSKSITSFFAPLRRGGVSSECSEATALGSKRKIDDANNAQESSHIPDDEHTTKIRADELIEERMSFFSVESMSPKWRGDIFLYHYITSSLR